MRLEIYSKKCLKSWDHLKDQINASMCTKLDSLKAAKVYSFNEKKLEASDVSSVFVDPVEEYSLSENDKNQNKSLDNSWIVEVGYQPGVTDNEATVATECLDIVLNKNVKSFSSSLWFIEGGNLCRKSVQKIAETHLGNPQIQRFKIYREKDLHWQNRFADTSYPEVTLSKNSLFKEINLKVSDDSLITLNEENCWALTLAELRAIEEYFIDLDKSLRLKKGLPSGPTDVEIEILAQTWSEHCKHKIFNAYSSFLAKKTRIFFCKELI